MREEGVAVQSFDLHLDLEKLGVSVDAEGNRSTEGRKLTVDLHVEASRGEFQTENGTFSFERFGVSFEMTETTFQSTESRPRGDAVDALKEPGSLLDEATAGEEQESFDLDDMVRLLDDQLDRLHNVLGRIGQGMQDMADRKAGKTSELEMTQMQLEVSIQTLSFVRPPPPPVKAEQAAEEPIPV